MRLTLLATNDLHGHISARAARQLADLKAAAQPALLLDSGDAVARGNVTWHWGGEWMHQRMGEAGYDAAALGNREYHFWQSAQRAKLALAPCPILSANVRPVGWGGTRPPMVRQLGEGLTVRLIGVTVQMVHDTHRLRWLTRSRFIEPAVAVQEALVEAGDDELVVVLSHLGRRRDYRLAEACPRIDVILGGHSHTPEKTQVGQTIISQAPAHGVAASRLVLEVGDALNHGGRVVDWHGDSINLEQDKLDE